MIKILCCRAGFQPAVQREIRVSTATREPKALPFREVQKKVSSSPDYDAAHWNDAQVYELEQRRYPELRCIHAMESAPGGDCERRTLIHESFPRLERTRNVLIYNRKYFPDNSLGKTAGASIVGMAI